MATLLILCIGLPLFVSILKALFSAACAILSGLLNLTASAIDSAARKKPQHLATVQVVTEKPNKYDLQIERKRATRLKQIEREEQQRRKEADRAEKERAKQAEKERVARFKAEQAKADLVHLEQMKQDLLKCYTVAEARYEAAKSDGEKEKALLRCMAYDNRARIIEKQIEQKRFIIGGV